MVFHRRFDTEDFMLKCFTRLVASKNSLLVAPRKSAGACEVARKITASAWTRK